MKIAAALFLLIGISCTNSRPKTDKQILDFGAFTIETPLGWKKIKERGTDSYVGSMAIDSTDTLHFDLGWYSNTLS